MSQIDTGGHAFPCGFSENGNSADQCGGLTIRDYFAGLAMQGICAGTCAHGPSGGLKNRAVAEDAYKLADAMLAARKTGGAS